MARLYHSRLGPCFRCVKVPEATVRPMLEEVSGTGRELYASAPVQANTRDMTRPRLKWPIRQTTERSVTSRRLFG
jgi:hypothetical protein